MFSFAVSAYLPEKKDLYGGIGFDTTEKAWYFYKTFDGKRIETRLTRLEPLDALAVAVRGIDSLGTFVSSDQAEYKETLLSLLDFAAPTYNFAYLYMMIVYDHFGRDHQDSWTRIIECDDKLVVSQCDDVSQVVKDKLNNRNGRAIISDLAKRAEIVSTAQKSLMSQSFKRQATLQRIIASKDLAALRFALTPWQIDVNATEWTKVSFESLLTELWQKITGHYDAAQKSGSSESDLKTAWSALQQYFTDLAQQLPAPAPVWVGYAQQFLQHAAGLLSKTTDAEAAYLLLSQQAELKRALSKSYKEEFTSEVIDFLAKAYDAADTDLAKHWRPSLQKALRSKNMAMVSYLLKKMKINHATTESINDVWLVEVVTDNKLPPNHPYFYAADLLWDSLQQVPEWSPLYRLWNKVASNNQHSFSEAEVTILEAARNIVCPDEKLKAVFNWRDDQLEAIKLHRAKADIEARHKAQRERVLQMTPTQLAKEKDLLNPYALARLAHENQALLCGPNKSSIDRDWFSGMDAAKRDSLLTATTYSILGQCLTKNNPAYALISWPPLLISEGYYIQEFMAAFKPKNEITYDLARVKAFVALVRIWDYLKFKSKTDPKYQATRQEDFLRLLVVLNSGTTSEDLEQYIVDSGKKQWFAPWHITVFGKTLVETSHIYQDLRMDLLNVVRLYGIQAVLDAKAIFENTLQAVQSTHANSLEAKIFRDHGSKMRGLASSFGTNSYTTSDANGIPSSGMVASMLLSKRN